MTRFPILRIVALVLALVATVSMTACGGSPTSDAAVYLVNNTSAVQFAPGSSVDWNTDQGVVLSAAPVPAVPTDMGPLTFPAPTNGAMTYKAFLAPAGSERKVAEWKTWGEPVALDGKGALLPAVWPGYLTNGNSLAVKNAGGTYSMGIAYLKDNDTTVVSAYFTTITITAAKGTWTFVTPTH